MLKPYFGMGNKNKAEALYLQKDRKPKDRASFEEDCEENVDYIIPWYKQWMIDKWGRDGSKLTMEEAIDFLGEPPKWEDLPEWLRTEQKTEEKKEELRGYHSQVPHELLCDPTIPHAAVRLYAVYHKFCKVKDLSKKPTTYVSRKRIGELMGVSEVTVWQNTKLLKQRGWLEVKHRKGTSNIVTLHDKPNDEIKELTH